MTDPETVLRPIRSTLRWLVAATVVLYLALGGLMIKTYLEANGTQDALCALRGDLEARVKTSEAFLDEHPEGVAGVPARTIREGIVNQQRTIDSLGDLSC